jgi:hypothetical protein
MRVQLVAVLMGLVLMAVAMPPLTTQARPGPIVDEAEWTELAQLRMAQAFLGEADDHAPDHKAIAWVLYRRWKIRCRNKGYIPLATFIRQYSAPLRVDLPRARTIRNLPWGDPLPGSPYATKNLTKRWSNARKLVTDWQAGRVKDPCPRALHWGGTMDTPKYNWHPVSCGRTRNIFYTVQRTKPHQG